MLLKIEKTKWKNCKEIIMKLMDRNKFLTPYSEYNFLNRIKKATNIHRFFEAKGFKLICYVVYDENNAILVAPLLINKKQQKIYLLGEFSSVGHLDFIYDVNLSVKTMKKALELVFSNYKGYDFKCDRLSQFSLTKQMFDEEKIDYINRDICVKIDLSDYERWYKSLSKSCRQNIRTSYNRLNRDTAQMTFYLFVFEKPSRKLWNDNIALFSKRILEHTNRPRLLLRPLIFFKKNEALGKALYETKNIIFASIYINDMLAASLNGVVGMDGRAIITRLSIETRMGKYSPGGIDFKRSNQICM